MYLISTDDADALCRNIDCLQTADALYVRPANGQIMAETL